MHAQQAGKERCICAVHRHIAALHRAARPLKITVTNENRHFLISPTPGARARARARGKLSRLHLSGEGERSPRQRARCITLNFADYAMRRIPEIGCPWSAGTLLEIARKLDLYKLRGGARGHRRDECLALKRTISRSIEPRLPM